MKLVSDTSALYTVQQGEEKGFTVIPLSVSIHDQHYRDLCFDISIFYDEIEAGHLPSSSQPPIGEVIEVYEKYADEEILHICMADGLSGTYQTALSAREQATNPERIIVLNSQTLCGPHRYLVEKAMRLMEAKKTMKEIVEALTDSIENTNS
ncbi:MAG: DegV family protein, partial [Longicatena sp.]